MYYLYRHLDLNGNTFYIGKSTKNGTKYNGHARAYAKSGRNADWEKIAKLGYTVEILEYIENEQDALDKEIELIEQCSSCTNKITAYTSFELSIKKINTNTAILKFGAEGKDSYYILLDSGRLFRHTGDEIFGNDNGKGYVSVGMGYRSNGKIVTKKLYMHRLVAQAFIPNPLDKKIVNHIDRNRSNNDVTNLEWCTQSENVQHSLKLRTT